MGKKAKMRFASGCALCATGAIVLLFLSVVSWVSAQTTIGGSYGPLVPMHGSISTAVPLKKFIGPLRGDRVLKNGRIYLNLRNKDELRRLSDQMQDMRSPMYGKAIPKDVWQKNYEPLPSEFDAIVAWLKSAGLTVGPPKISDRYVPFSGTVAQINKTFGITIQMTDDGYYANTTEVQLPSALAPWVVDVRGLDNLLSGSPAALIGGQTAFAPSDFYTFYDEQPQLTAGITGNSGDCLGIVSLSDFNSSATGRFDGEFDLPNPAFSEKFAEKLPNGTTDDPGTTANELETLLDFEWGHAAAPGAPIILYLGNPATPAGEARGVAQAVIDATNLAVSDNACGAVSISFMLCGLSTATLDALDSTFMTADMANHQSVFVASDDFGTAALVPSGGGCKPSTSLLGVNELATDPHVTAVGGTQFSPNLDVNSDDVSFVAEQVWDASNGASGGGASSFFTQPNFQAGFAPPDDKRHIPDVSLLAGAPGVFLGDDPARPPTPEVPNCPSGSVNSCIDGPLGGTSLATPIWAGIAKLIAQIEGQRIGNINTALYKLAGRATDVGFREALSGDNGFNGVPGFSPNPKGGYNQATGWGTPDISKFVRAFVSDRALILGGNNGNSVVDTAEVYVPQLGCFGLNSSSTGYAARQSPIVSGLPNGKLMLAGGGASCVNGGSQGDLSSSEVFDPGAPPLTPSCSSVEFGSFTASGTMVQPGCSGGSAVALLSAITPSNHSDHGWVFFDLNQQADTPPSPPPEFFDFGTAGGTFIGTSNITPSGYGVGSVLLRDGRILYVDEFFQTISIYDPVTTETTVQTAMLDQIRAFATLVLLEDGRVLIAGGYHFQGLMGVPASSAVIYDPIMNKVSPTGSMNEARDFCPGVLLNTGKALVIGSDGTADIYDPVSGTFTAAGAMAAATFEPLVTTLPNGQVLIAGGLFPPPPNPNGTSTLSSAELFDPATGEFSPTGSLLQPRDGGFATMVR